MTSHPHPATNPALRLAGRAAALAIMLLTALLLSGSAIAFSPTTPVLRVIYVSPQGDDHNPGTMDRPVRTLQHARDLARVLLASAAGSVTIDLAGGVYRLTEPLTLTPADSGEPGNDMIYAALPGERPILSGGVRITGWKLVDPARHLWAAPAPVQVTNTRQLYVNGVRALRTRGRPPVKLTQTKTGYTADSDLMSHWKNPRDIEFVYTGGNGLWSEHSNGLGAWTEPRCPVASIHGATITMAQPCWDNSTRRVPLPPGSGFKRSANLVGPAHVGRSPEYIENAYELLGTPGQWYLDRPHHTFYYVPRPGEDLATADVEAPLLENLVVGHGTADDPIHDLQFVGIQFSYATWLAPSGPDGFSEIQANYTVTGPRGYAVQGLCSLVPGGECPYGAWTKEPGNVSFQYDRDIYFIEDNFTHLGAAGLDLGDGSQQDIVRGCVFTDISGNGLELGGVDQPAAPVGGMTRDDRILNNRIYEVADEYHGGVGIDVGYARRCVIAHNQLDHLPYTAISIGWGGWPDKIHQAGVASDSAENLIANNLIFEHMLVLADGGGIYTQGLTGPSLAEGERVTGNVIHDQFSSGHAIYTDNGSCNITITGNALYRDNFDNWGSRHRDYYEGAGGKLYDPLDVEGNYWEQGDSDSSTKNVTVKNNTIITALAQIPASLMKGAGLETPYPQILKLWFGHDAAPEPPMRVAASAGDGAALVTWNPPVLDSGNPVTEYTVTSSEGNSASISAADFDSAGYLRMAGLKNAVPCDFIVRATNGAGTSSPSIPSLPVTPGILDLKKPGAPARIFVRRQKDAASVHFQAPKNDGGSPVTTYMLTINPGGRRLKIEGREVLTLGGKHTMFAVVGGLQSDRPYTFDLSAVNAAGEGPPAEAIRPASLQ